MDEQSEYRVPSSPLKKSWADHESPASNHFDTNENFMPDEHYDEDEMDEINDEVDFEGAASSPFQYDGNEETVDYQKIPGYQNQTPTMLRSRFAMAQMEDPMSSPFRPEARDETVDFQRLREVQPLSPGISKRLAVDNPLSSPFRAEVQDESDEYDDLRDMHNGSPDFDDQPEEPQSSPFKPESRQFSGYNTQPEDPQSSPFRPETRDFSGYDEQPQEPHSSPFRPEIKEREETFAFQELEERESKHESLSKPRSASPVACDSPIQPEPKDITLDMPKLRSAPRASLSVPETQPKATTPRKRSFDQTPQDDDVNQTNERAKKGMVSRQDAPEIHVDLDEESSILHHDQSLLSTASAAQDRSNIANSMIEDKRNEGMSTVLHDNDEPTEKENLDYNDENNRPLDEDEDDTMDETGFSEFSVLPDMTSFAKLRAESPMKSMRGSVGPSHGYGADMYRRSMDHATPRTARRSHGSGALVDFDSQIGSPTPRRRPSRDVGHASETPNLLDLTDQMNFYPLTPRELESLKSGFMSEISSLKATLSGKEAEVASLKTAVGDAERRVGEALEEIRNEAARREAIEIEQAEWDRRGKDMERVLQSVRAELEDGERERDRLTRKADEAERSKEQLEGRIVELETQLSTARSSASSQAASAPGSRKSSQSAEDTAREVQDAVEKVARELHTLYKSKHETKVAALKKSYESRWEKRLRESENKLNAARAENERLKVEYDATSSDSMAAANASMIARENDEHEAEKRVFEAQIKGLQQEMASLKEDSERLRADLKTERAEKGELVAAVDEWLAIQQGPSAPAQQERQSSVVSAVSSAGLPAEDSHATEEPPAEPFRRSITRPGSSGIRPPATAEKKNRFGAPGGHARGNSGGKSGIAVFTPGRGGIMSSIERMGRGGS
ncbi:Central kinetochore-associated [Penicillium herquei]|nr:Central kinetochore-associated [Penicillium herquei]